jgi:hypothetical protein
VIPDDSNEHSGVERDPSLDSMSSRFTNDSSGITPLCGNAYMVTAHCKILLSLSPLSWIIADGDINLDEQEEKARLIAQVMELQNTLDGKSTYACP